MTEGSVPQVLAGEAAWSVVAGDCLAELPLLPPLSVDHVISDPPFEAHAHTKQRRVRRGNEALSFEALSFEALSFEALSFEAREIVGREAGRLVKRWCLLFCQVEGSALWREAVALEYVRTSIWVKPDAMPQYTGDRPGMGYESIVVCHRKGKKRWNGGGRTGVFTHNKRNTEDAGGKGWHETMKPQPLMRELVELFTDPGDLVLDPFCGSGSTGMACVRLGRRFIGIEKNPDWAELSRERLRAEEHGSTFEARRSGQEALFR